MTLLSTFRRGVSAALRAAAARIDPAPAAGDSYAARAAQEVARFERDVDVHALPEIFHYWSNKYLRPVLETLGFSHPDDFYAVQIAGQSARAGRPVRVVSIGSGNCDTEVRVAKLLLERGIGDARFTCVDLNPAMLERGRALAEQGGVATRFEFEVADFNRWKASATYDVAMANQSLHHVVELEALFDAVARAIGRDGIFVTSDMIGRNGHQCWPEALEIVQEFWQELPETYRYNVQLNRHEHEYMNWDCSVEGFEGVRAQDILPLLVERFGFRLFHGYANVVDPFVGRSFGHHFDVESAQDREFIDRVHLRDEAEILAGRIKPTHMIGVMTNARAETPRVWRHLTPGFCVRPV